MMKIEADYSIRARGVTFVAASLLALQLPAAGQSHYKAPRPDDSNQAVTLSTAVLAVAPQPPTAPPIPQNQVAATVQNVTATLSVSPVTFAQMLAFNPEVNQAVSDVATNQVSSTRQVHDPAKFRVVRKLVKTLCEVSPELRADALQTIYDNAAQVSTVELLNENEQLCSLIHAAKVRNGQAAEYEFRRSAIYKRIQRRRLYLLDHPVQP